ncbi:unnamed protein product [Thelazia callipaeda]|uniref:Aromatic-L-amino-acid decarboxylase n=1 Tax=Thelazia callipaeda TaxID=103827 RepID=A0A0N5D1I8_THECL|nr:unnamed protein product [Thelazia callipaeda]
MIGLPDAFLPFTENGKGGGVIQGSASECNFVSLLAARFEVLKELKQRFPFVEEGLLLVKDRYKLTQALVVDPLYLQHSWTVILDKAIDYRHWSIPLSRRFRSLKLWFVIRAYGVEGLQNYIRRVQYFNTLVEHLKMKLSLNKHCYLAKLFEQLVRTDKLFEIVGDVILGLVCFRMIASEEMNQELLTKFKLNSSGHIHMVPASLNGRFVIRFCVCSEHATEKDIHIAYNLISQTARHIYHNSVSYPLIEDEELNQPEETKYAAQICSLFFCCFIANEYKGFQSDCKGYGKEEMLSKKEQTTRSQRRSFLVRMVSDPKCYNPKIVRHLTMSGFRKMTEDVTRDFSLRLIKISVEYMKNKQYCH